ncbi:MAG: FkbM family methyltransferase, partial [Candidatus Marsarchaeota archaeon]|nr:FkbM family methyltransferase [Candidatus Marsarchaeota archaeon]
PTAFIVRYCAACIHREWDGQGEILFHLQGHVFRGDLHEMRPVLEVYLLRVYERAQDFITQAGWTVIDVGANVGVFTVQQASRGAHVIAVEPNPLAFRRLCATIERNGFHRLVTALPYAAGTQRGSGSLAPEDKHSPHGRIIFRGGEEDAGVIPVVTLDEIAATHGVATIDLLKIDVEGAEVAVLEGASATLPRVKRLVLEYHSPSLLAQLRQLLATADFEEVVDLKPYSDSGLGILYYIHRC